MAIPHNKILLTIAPDDYHIQAVGRTGDGLQVFITSCFNYDPNSMSTTDYDVAFRWDSHGKFLNAEIVKIGKRGDPQSRKDNGLTLKSQGITMDSIRVRPCSVNYDGLIFGLIPRTGDGETVVELMPGNSLCFLEPFDGEYDT